MDHGLRLEGAILLLLYSARFEPFWECQVKLFAVFLGAIALLFSACAEAEPLPTEQALKERVLGDPKAPITLVEYSSLGCPHCASFHANTLPKIKKNYIDTGKVKLIMRDFPLGGAAYAAAMMARCAPPNRYFQFIEVLFQNQQSWSHSQQPGAALARIGKLGGMSQKDFEACTGNKELFEGIRKLQLEGQEKHGVNATPTFLVNGQKISGAQPYEVFEEAFKKAMP